MDVGDLHEADDNELATACSQTPQLPPNFSVVYQCKADVGDYHRCLPRKPRKGQTLVRRWTLVTPCEADIGDLCEADVGDLCEGDEHELATACSQMPQFPPALARVPAYSTFTLRSPQEKLE